MVCTAAETEMGLIARCQGIERVRIESVRIERVRVRRAAAREARGVQSDHDRGAGREGQPVDDDVAGGDSRSDADGSDVAKRLFDVLGDPRRIRSQRRVVLGPVGQHRERRSQLVAGGIGARQQERLDHSDQLVSAQPVAVLGDRDEF